MTNFQEYRKLILVELDAFLLPHGYTRKKAIYAQPVKGGYYTIELERHLKSAPGAPMFTVTLQVFSRREREVLGLSVDPYRSGIVSGLCRPENPDWLPVSDVSSAQFAARYFVEFLRTTGFAYLAERHRELMKQYGA